MKKLMLPAILVLCLPLLILKAQDADKPTAPKGWPKIKLVSVWPQFKFVKPLDFQVPDDGLNRAYIVEQDGRILSLPLKKEVKERTEVLDIRQAVYTRHTEEGLLGLAFHPNYKENGYLYVYYSMNKPRRSRVARFSRSKTNPLVADPKSEKVLLEFNQPWGNHNGGGIAFGPDGLFYIGVGDGGAGGDPLNHGQNKKTLLGTMLRIDVDNPAKGKAYGIPKDNPFAGNDKGYREEIYAYGLRNPWRFAFDPSGKFIWTGDVGQNEWEELSLVEKGKNYGWKIKEGTHDYEADPNSKEKLVGPLLDYAIGRKWGRSIIGGFVYEGKGIPALKGAYLYTDFYTGVIWGVRINEDRTLKENKVLLRQPIWCPGIGRDLEGELYFTSFKGGIYKLVQSK